MNLHTSILALIIVAFALCSCATDPRKSDQWAGMVAARNMGQTTCLGYPYKRHVETVAVFEFDGKPWVYHPAIGSQEVPRDLDLKQYFKGSVWMPVLCVPEDAELLRGCLPDAIAEVRQKGGHVVYSPVRQHAYRIP